MDTQADDKITFVVTGSYRPPQIRVYLISDEGKLFFIDVPPEGASVPAAGRIVTRDKWLAAGGVDG